jgi:hypothetical protein
MFRITKKANNRTGVKKIEALTSSLYIERDSVLSKVNVSGYIDKITAGELRILQNYTFEDAISALSMAYKEDRYFDSELDFSICKKCEFKTNQDSSDKKSGFKECFTRKLGWTEDDFNSPNAFEIYDFRRWKDLNKSGMLMLKDIPDERFGEEKKVEGKISRVTRQLIQKHKSLEGDFAPYILKDELSKELNSWIFPLNFIDFEASTVALPFYAGQKPYEKIVFQFSHHIYHKDGKIEHANEYINVQAGVFPNFEFVRNLKLALSKNKGTVFQFSPYENSTLNQVKFQIEESNEEDKYELIEFIKTLTTPPSRKDYNGELWKPSRGMVDLCEVIKAYYYNPYTKGSNSIKAVLPAIFKSSSFIRDKYSKPLGDLILTSKNFSSYHVWLNLSAGGEVDPYKSLGKPFEEWDDSFERISDIDEINNGGAALTAYGLTQYHDMDEREREKIKSSLLKYCELDTLAMVMVYEHLRELCET